MTEKEEAIVFLEPDFQLSKYQVEHDSFPLYFYFSNGEEVWSFLIVLTFYSTFRCK